MKQKHFIDSHKGATALFILAMMALYDQWGNATAWLYLATHGVYGALWVLKSHYFPDRQWEQPCSVGYAAVIWASLSLYWITPWLIASRALEAPPWLMGISVAMFSFGVFFHFVSDMQKHVQLSLKRGLITDGVWARCRNPNYLGELLIYAGFGLLAGTWAWVSLGVLGLFVAFVWVPNMKRKDASLSRYPEFEAYKANSWLLIPFVI